MKKQTDYTVSIGLLLCLFALSFYKDDLTPDYLNSEGAAFLAPDQTAGVSRLSLIIPNFTFWLVAIAYSITFAVLPYYIIKLSTNLSFSRLVLGGLLSIVLIEYILIFLNMKSLDYAIIPKVNRFYHSPIITLFLIAASTVNDRIKDDK